MAIGQMLKTMVKTPVAVGARIEKSSPMIRKVTGPINRLLPSVPLAGAVGTLVLGAAVIMLLANLMSRLYGGVL